MTSKRTAALLLITILCALVLLPCVSLSASAADIVDETPDESKASQPDVRYTNPDTEHTVTIVDEIGVLTDFEEEKLMSLSAPLTKYCTVIFWSNTLDYNASLKKLDQWVNKDGKEIDATVFIVQEGGDSYAFGTCGDFSNQFEDGFNQDVFDEIDESADSVYNAALIAYSRVYKTVDGEELPEYEMAIPQALRYTNPDTGFQIMILDEIDLLTASEEKKLVEDMKPLTEYGSVAFWSTDKKTNDEIDQAREKRKELFEYQSASVFVINMNVRKLTVQSYGFLYKYITDSNARSITDNVSKLAKNQEYYKCASKVYDSMYRIVNGYDIPEPMKIKGYVIVSLMIGLIAALSIAFSSRFNPLRKKAIDTQAVKGTGKLCSNAREQVVSTATCYRSSSSGSGCGGGGCGGGGGGCGGGGSSSF